MASFELHVDVDLKKIEKAWSTEEMVRRRKDFTDSVADMMEPYVPMSGGGKQKSHMRDRGNRIIGDGTITYTANYAARVYAMGDNVNYTTPGTRGHWDELFASKDGDKLVKAAEALLMEGIS